MTVQEILPIIQKLPRVDKLRIIQVLAKDIETLEEDIYAAAVVESLRTSSQAAQKMMEIIESRKSNTSN